MYKIKNITKEFKIISWGSILFGSQKQKHIALSNISLDLPSNGIIGVTGENGSGKTTLLKILSNTLKADGGSIDSEFKKRNPTYISGGDRSFFWRLTARQNLMFFGSLYGKTQIEIKEDIKKLSIEFNAEQYLDYEFMTLSSGNKKKMSLIRAFMKCSDILLFDEVTNSLDSECKNILYRKIKIAANKKKSLILWSSHDEAELKILTDKLICLSKGKLMRCENFEK